MTERTTTIAEQAVEKMLKEMNVAHSKFADTVHNWLCEKEQTANEELMSGILNPTKSLENCERYVMKRAKEKAENRVAVVDSDTVFGWVVTYFTTEVLVEVEEKKYVSAPKPTKEQMDRIEKQQEDLKKAAIENKIQAETKKAEAKGMLSIFDFMDEPKEGEVDDDDSNECECEE